MNDLQSVEFTVFIGTRRLASGPLDQVALAAKKAVDRGAQQPVLIYNDSTGRAIDIDSRGTDTEMLDRLAPPPPPPPPPGRRRARPPPGAPQRTPFAHPLPRLVDPTPRRPP